MSANPYMAAQFAAEAKRREESAAGKYDWTRAPDWRREWLGQWVLDASARVYRFDDRVNVLADSTIAASLLRGDPEWTYLLGVDLGWKDATAIVLGAYRAADPRYYVVRSFARPEMTYGALGRELKEIAGQYRVARVLVDVSSGPAKQLAESLRVDHALPVTAAEKTEKASYVGRMNSDFVEGRIQCIAENRELFKEWHELVLDSKKSDWAEAKRFANHLADAALYAWRDSLHRFQSAPVAPVAPSMTQTVLARKRLEMRESVGPRPSRIGDWG
jgi:hypothetical protein